MSILSPYRFRVALHDTDVAGVLFFGHLFRHAHDAYEAMMDAIGFPIERMIRERSLGLPLVNAEANFCRPLRHGDEVQVRVSISMVTQQRFTVGYRFICANQEAATARTIHAAIDPLTGRPCPLPDSLRETLRQVHGDSIAESAAVKNPTITTT